MALEISGNNKSVAKNLSTASIFIVLSVIAFLSGSLMSAMDDDVSLFSALLMLGGLVFGSLAFFYPITEAMNVASKIDIINEYNINDDKEVADKIAIAHPQRTLVVLLTLVSPFLAFIPWIAALWIVSGPFSVRLADDVAARLNHEGLSAAKNETNATELVSLKKLLDSGEITVEQYEERKKNLGF